MLSITYPGVQLFLKSMNCCPAQLTTAVVQSGKPDLSKVVQDMLLAAGIRDTFTTL